MKKLLALLLTLSFAIQAFGVVAFADEVQTKVPSQLHVEGNKLFNAEGEQVKLVGTCIDSMEWAGGENMVEKVNMSMDNWNSNVVRIPISGNGWYGKWWYIGDSGAKYRADLQTLVDMISAKGKYVIIDLHHFGWITPDDVKIWEEIVPIYKNNPAVIFDLFNESHSTDWNTWRNGGTIVQNGKPQEVVGFQTLVNRVREMGAKNIVQVGGLDWSYQLYSMVPGYDGLENGYQILEPEGGNKGYGVMYDTHIYPVKGGEDNWSRMVGVATPYIPILSGEFGHFNWRLNEWFANSYLEYPKVWNNQLMNFYDLNGINYTSFSFHQSCAPAALRDAKSYLTTPYSGFIQKFWLVHNEVNNMPPIEERSIQDPAPLYTWSKVVDFDEVSPDVKVYKETDDTFIATEKRPDGVTGSSQLMSFDIPKGQEGKAAITADFPSDWNFSGASYVNFRWRGDGDMRDMIVGLELKDGRQFSTKFPINMNKNWQRNVYNMESFLGDYGLFDYSQIKSFFFSPATAGKGSFAIDDFEIGGLEPKEVTPTTLVDKCEGAETQWTAWADTEGTRYDSFGTVTAQGQGVGGTNGRKFSYVRPEGSSGGQARGIFPSTWNLNDANYMVFDVKGDGTTQNLLLRLDTGKYGITKSNFTQREFERFAKKITISGNDWQKVVIRLSEFGMYDTFEKDKLDAMSIFNLTPNSKGSFIIDNLSFYTNYDQGLKSEYTMHPEPVSSGPVGDLMHEYPDNIVYQYCNEEEGVKAVGAKLDDPTTPMGSSELIGDRVPLNAGSKNYLHFTILNKTDNRIDGLLTIEGLPEGTTFEEKGQYIPYTIAWREQNSVAFAFTPPDDAKGDYTIRVIDAYAKGTQAKEYKVTIK